MTDNASNGGASDIVRLPRHIEPDELIGLVAQGVKAIDPLLGYFAKACADIAREKRLEIEARLKTRLEELIRFFDKLDELRAREIEEREIQYEALMVLLDVAKSTGDPELVLNGMQCFQEYVRHTPSLTRDFAEAVRAVDFAIEPFPGNESRD